MALTITIDTPVASCGTNGSISISVTAHATVDGSEFANQTFSTSTSTTDASARATVVNTLSIQLAAWKATLVKQQAADALMGALKTALEAKL